VRNVDAQFPNNDILTHVINQYTCPNDNYFFDAEALAEQHFGDHLASNLIVIGVAFQRGLIPISADAIERAITLNGERREIAEALTCQQLLEQLAGHHTNKGQRHHHKSGLFGGLFGGGG
jgi:hypothetical protein